ncbi:MAG: hypothetical protein ABI140_03025 [Jatrophihabitantaceae bacterium]
MLLGERIDATRAALASSSGRAVEWRVAGSIFEVGLLARVISPLLAIALLRNEIVHPQLAELHWQPAGGGLRLSRPDGCARTAVTDSGELAREFGRLVLAGPVAELVAAIGSACQLSDRIGWGNVASAINGATIVLRTVRPALAGPANQLAAAILAVPPLQLAGSEVGPAFRRDSCCLLYRVTGRQAVCADCVLAPAWTDRPLR